MSSIDYGKERWMCPFCTKMQDIKTIVDGVAVEYLLQHCECGHVFDPTCWIIVEES